ncbi:MAG TPA: hypothetical protein VIK43_07985 [Cellulomonas sp.]
MSSELQAVTAAMTEMRASTESVAHGVNAASGEADRAVGATAEAAVIVARLGDSWSQIAAVLDTVTSIATQTHLLALDATVDEHQSSMSVVVEQQTATTGEIERNLIVAADSSTDIAQSAGAVAQAASQSFDSAAEVRLVVGELSRVATELNAGVEELTLVSR